MYILSTKLNITELNGAEKKEVWHKTWNLPTSFEFGYKTNVFFSFLAVAFHREWIVEIDMATTVSSWFAHSRIALDDIVNGVDIFLSLCKEFTNAGYIKSGFKRF